MGDQLAGAGAPCDRLDTAAAAGLYLNGRALTQRARALAARCERSLGAAFREPGCRTPLLELPFITFDQAARH
jgi:hypothetical protein